MERGPPFDYDDWAARDRYGYSRGSTNFDGRIPPTRIGYPGNDVRRNFYDIDHKQTTRDGYTPESVKNAQSSNGSAFARGSSQDQDSNSESTRKKRAVRIVQRFAEKCSMQGPSYIFSSTWWFSRLAWTLLLLVAMGAMSYHLYYLCRTYFAWPTKHKLSLGFSSLQFPAVTVCNVNPVRASGLDELSTDLNMFLQQIDPDAIADKIDNLPDRNTRTSSTGRKRRQASDEDDEYTDQLDDIDFGQAFDNYTNAREDVDDSFYDELDGYTDSWEKEAKKSSLFTIEKNFRELYAAENRPSRVKAGHQLKDMLLSCSFAGSTCYPRNFTLTTSSTYGNCFTLEYSKFISRTSGPNGGLELLFYLDTEEYIRGVTPDDGLQVSVHPQQTVAFPADEGVAVSAGTYTMLSLKLIQIERQGQPYGDCSEPVDYLQKYKILYSQPICSRFCQQEEIHRSCNCTDDTQEDVNRLMNVAWLRPCRKKKEVECLIRAQWRYQNGDVQCSCYNPCTESKYEKSQSSRPWPNQDYAESILVRLACKRVSAEKCQRLRSKQSHELSREFIKLNIFYEDLNYENITEEPDYETVQFISDVGGTLGLWIGLSVLSIMEVLQLLLELIRHFCCCRWTAAAAHTTAN